MNDSNPISTVDNTAPVTEEEYNEGMWISVMVGLYYTFNAFLPITVWYGERRVGVKAMEGNTLYELAWYTMYALHFFVFLPMAMIWPMTYTRATVVVEAYDLANLYLGTYAAGVVYIFVAFMWLLAVITFEDTTSITKRGVFYEFLLYVLIENFAWYVTVWEYSKAHEQFYFANRRQVTLDRQEIPDNNT